MTTETLTREIKFEKGYDCSTGTCAFGKETCKPGLGGYHGVHGVNMRWLLKGPKGVVQWLVYTNWFTKEFNDRYENDWPGWMWQPMMADLGYHSPTPKYIEQDLMSKECEYLDGAPCYYDGSGLNAEPIMDLLFNEGDEAVWKYLEQYYKQVFNG